ncbi:helix-turn-helix domain-containing protein [Marixanthomonas spongiae]|uniref:Transcriptional regulator n=1 Tax=Marixanthomonas spongiae TaxID=2174845 RepID=A0A2U0HYL2_9FLAO|nr:transcriptional regulator [Marixanthomonas spongiae]
MVNSEDFTKRLEKIMGFYGLSATAFSEAIEFNRSTISHLLSGRNKPSLEFVMKVIQTFPEVELYWLLNGKGTFPPNENNKIGSNTEKKTQIKKTALDNPESQDSVTTKKEIDRIVIFYSDGSFKAYEK